MCVNGVLRAFTDFRMSGYHLTVIYCGTLCSAVQSTIKPARLAMVQGF